MTFNRSHFSLYGSAIAGGVVAAVVIFVGTELLGGINDNEAVERLREIRPTLRFTANGAMTATATILALMLTLLSISHDAEAKLSGFHYDRIWWIARFAVATFITALILLMLLNVPVNSSRETLGGVYDYIYYGVIAYISIIGGLLITVVLLLYQAARDIIIIAHPDRRASDLARDGDREAPSPRRKRDRMVELEEELEK